MARQMAAIVTAGDRTAALRSVDLPHWWCTARPTAAELSGGQATARAIPGAELLTVAGMGHDLPPSSWGRSSRRSSAPPPVAEPRSTTCPPAVGPVRLGPVRPAGPWPGRQVAETTPARATSPRIFRPIGNVRTVELVRGECGRCGASWVGADAATARRCCQTGRRGVFDATGRPTGASPVARCAC